jgi:hypothetical protein
LLEQLQSTKKAAQEKDIQQRAARLRKLEGKGAVGKAGLVGGVEGGKVEKSGIDGNTTNTSAATADAGLDA